MLGLPQSTKIWVFFYIYFWYPEKDPAVLSFMGGHIPPGSSAPVQRRGSVVELLLVLIPVGAARWVLCSKPSPISLLG